jgi:nucleoside-diphosphate-sugar epimerase
MPLHMDRLDDLAAVRKVMSHCDAVVHLAGRVHVLRDLSRNPAAEFRLANTQLTRALALAAVQSGIRRFVLMSSIAAVSNARSVTVSDESVDEPDTDYGRSKLEAEQALHDIAEGAGLRAVTLRPPMVFGEWMRGNPLRLFRYIASGAPVPVVRPPCTRSTMYAGNVAEAVHMALAMGELEGRFCLADGEPLTIEAFTRAAAASLGRPARIVAVPAGMLRAAGAVGEQIDRFLPCPLTRRSAARLCQSLVVDGSRFSRLTRFEPTYSTAEALDRTAAWFIRACRSA